MSTNLVQIKKFHSLIFFILLIASGSANGQNNQKLNRTVDNVSNTTGKITDLINRGAALKRALDQLKFTTAKNTQDFNQNVKVTKGNDDQNIKEIKEKKLNKPVIKDDKFSNLIWDSVIYFNNQLFPSSIICMNNYAGNLQGLLEAISRPIGFKVLSSESNIPIKWEVECMDKKYFDKVSGSVLYSDANKLTYVMPEIPWNYENLARQETPTQITVNLRLFDKAGNKIEKSLNLNLRSIDDCIFRYKDLPLEFLFTGYVQETHPEIAKILEQARNTKLAKDMNGYDGNESSVDLQVAAVWRVLHERGLKYNSPQLTTNNSQDILIQQVRTFDNAIKPGQPMTDVDGAIVFASILRALHIHSVIELTPTRCFLEYYTDDAKTKIKYVETSMLSQSSYVDKKTKKTMTLDKAKTNDEKNKIFTGLFLAAVDKGSIEHKESELNNTNTVVDIDAMRDLIKKPIPF